MDDPLAANKCSDLGQEGPILSVTKERRRSMRGGLAGQG